MLRVLLISITALIVLGAAALHFRFDLAVAALSSDSPPPLLDKRELSSTERWFDDYYTIDSIDARTHVIGEPRASGPVFSYLIEGRDRAILFDIGYPSANILPVVKSLTDKPILAVPSHLHFDHVGNLERFDDIALLDTPQRRSQMEGDVFTPLDVQYLGSSEGHATPSWKITKWLSDGETIDLGDRTLKVVLTPGHTDESISLWDEANGQLFTGDYIYEGPLYAFLPNSSLADYLKVAENLLLTLPAETKLYTAHRMNMTGTPVLEMRDIVDLRDALEAVRDGEAIGSGFFPTRYSVNERLDLDADIPWYQDWGN
jgi:glyoxylase-like metal-dependent hydrolase (beta-lactamase superfamily II)